MKNTWIVAVMLCLACGDDSNGRGSGVPGSKVVSDLTVSELRAVCRSIYAGENPDGTPIQWCTFGAASSSDSKEDCIAARDLCIEEERELADEEPDDGDDCEELTAEDVPQCDVTVGELERCLKDELAMMRAVVSKASCDKLGGPDDPFETPASCGKIPSDCFDDEVDDSVDALQAKSRLRAHR